MISELYLIDGLNMVFRSCLVKGPVLTNSIGEVTTGTYFFTKTLLKLCNRKPDFLVFCLDAPRKTLIRRQLDETYKSKRNGELPEELVIQVGRCVQISKLLGIPICCYDGYEADDIIATLATRNQYDKECIIFSSDKDLHQLVNERITIYDMLKDQKIEEADVIKKWGVPPDKIVEMQILMGDPVDGIKGVEGIGPKTALDLILNFGTADNAQVNADYLKPKKAEALKKANIPLLRKMVTMERDVPISKDVEELRFGGLQEFSPELRELFTYLGFSRWAKQK